MPFQSLKNRIVAGVGVSALLGFGFLFGQTEGRDLSAQQIKPAVAPEKSAPEKPSPAIADESRRVVAYIHGTKALTREEFGEYLIQRVGRERIELFVNKRIIELAAAEKGIEIAQVEIDAVIEEDCRLLSIEKADFVQTVLKKYNKTLYEWKEDVIKPRLLMTKMLRDQIKVEEGDLKKMYENRYGKKVKAQAIIWPKSDGNYLKHAQQKYDEIRKSDVAFNAVARAQADQFLASKEGHVEPIARWSPTGDHTVEDAVFSLEPGQLTRIIDTPVGAVVLKCNGFVDARADVSFDKVKADLLKEVIDQKISIEVPKLCEQLKAEAKPVYVLQPGKMKASDMDREIKREIEPVGFKDGPKK